MARKPSNPPSRSSAPRRGRPPGKAGAASKTPTSLGARRSRPPSKAATARATARQPTKQSPARRARSGKTPSALPSPRGARARTEAIAAALQQLQDQLGALSAAVQSIDAKLDAALQSTGQSSRHDPGDGVSTGAAVPSPAPLSGEAQAASEESEPGVPDEAEAEASPTSD